MKITKDTIISLKKKSLFIIKNNPKRTAVFAVLLICFIIVLNYYIGMLSLQKELMRGWSTTGSSKGKYYEMVLEFDGENISYSYDSKDSDVNETITKYTYEVASPNEIRIDGRKEKIKVEFNEEKNLMTVSPGIVNNDEFEFWHNDN